MRDVAALVLAGGQSASTFGPLTHNRPKGALTFAGTYRIIDFTLSRLRSARIEQVGIAIQFLPASLIAHVGIGQPWDMNGFGRCLRVMPPFVGIETTSWYRGTADALFQNLNFIGDIGPEHVVVASGEHVHNIDIAGAMAFHRDTKADVTFVTVELPPDRLSPRFGYVLTNAEGRVVRYDEKPEQPSGSVVSTGMYIFKTEILKALLHANSGKKSQNLASDILSPNVEQLNTMEYRWTGTWEYLSDPEEYLAAHLRLVHQDEALALRNWGILTNLEYRNTAARAATMFGTTGTSEDSLLSAGCRIDGDVRESVLSPGVHVTAGAVVSRSVVFHDSKLHAGARLNNTILDKDVVISDDCVVGGTEPDAPVTLIGKAVHIGPGIVIPAGVRIAPGVRIIHQQEADALAAE